MNGSDQKPSAGAGEMDALRGRIATLEETLARSRQSGRDLQLREQQLTAHNLVLMQLSRSKAVEEGDVGRALREITESAARTLEVERASVWLFSPDRSAIRCLDLYRRSADAHEDDMTLAAAEYPVYFRAVEQNRTIAADDARTDPRTREFRDSYLGPLGITSMLDAPIRAGGRLTGIICHEHVGPPRRWTLEDQAFAGSMADFVAIALQAGERRQAEERRVLMLQELNHRVKNNLAAVLALVEQTAAGARSVRDFIEAFTARIRAMAVAHEMLAQARWRGAELGGVLQRLIEPYQANAHDRIRLAGPPIMLPAVIVPPLCMVVHELLANAVRHGSLSAARGSVEIQWSAETTGDGQRRLEITWQERDGPPVQPPARRGFGTDFIERTTSYQLKGEARLAFDAAGLRCRLMVPLPDMPPDDAVDSAATEPMTPSPPRGEGEDDLEGLRVLVVEDDALVAMALAQFLAEMGCRVIGPVATADEACELVKKESLDAAVLDINLSPGSSAPVARALQYRRCPFLFVTGYSTIKALPDDLRGFRVLAKPIDRRTLERAVQDLVHAAHA
jgi:two-component sensor histidine kinase